MKLKNIFATSALTLSLGAVGIQNANAAFSDGDVVAQAFYGGAAFTGEYSDAFLSVYDPSRKETFYLGLGNTETVLNEIASRTLQVESGGAGSLGEWMGMATDFTGFKYNFGGLQNGCPALADCLVPGESVLPSGEGNFQMLISVGTGQAAPGSTTGSGFRAAMTNMGRVLAAADSGSIAGEAVGGASWVGGNWGDSAGSALGFSTTGEWDGNAFTPITAALLGADADPADFQNANAWNLTIDDAFGNVPFGLSFDEGTNTASFAVVPVPAALWMLAPALAFLARIRRNS